MPHKTNDFIANLPAVHRALAHWYKGNGRHHLPWRITRDPYAIYISEVMLQQTQVKTVLERYYAPFLKRFPTLDSLAKAKSEEVTKQWQGLGYYNRAANLHAAARSCGGALPKTMDGLMALPGIGRNTAHAVACFAYGAPHAVMEANVKRVLHRVFALKKSNDKILWRKAGQLLDTKKPFDYNQAMMDIGALVCTKRNPLCTDCPLNPICKGKERPEAYPAAKITKRVPVRNLTMVVVIDKNNQLYLMQRKTRFLNGLYGFMECTADAKTVWFAGKKYKLLSKDKIGFVVQSYSHFTLNAPVYLLSVAVQAVRNVEGFHKVSLEKVRGLPLSRADSKIVEMIAGHVGLTTFGQ